MKLIPILWGWGAAPPLSGFFLLPLPGAGYGYSHADIEASATPDAKLISLYFQSKITLAQGVYLVCMDDTDMPGTKGTGWLV
jgi:hypothetical protein